MAQTRRQRLAGHTDLHGIAVEPHRPDAQALLGVFQAAAVFQAEVLLVQRRGDDQVTLALADYAATYDVGAGLGVAIFGGVDLFTVRGVRQVEERDLYALEPGDHAGVGDQILTAAQLPPLGGVGGGGAISHPPTPLLPPNT